MEVPVYNMSGEEVSNVELPADIFEAKINRDLMHQSLVRQLANKRLGTHKAKGRSEVNRSTKKIYRQKGTGNARHGSRRAPIFVGGGVAHGPLPRSYEKKMPRKMRRAALRSALSVKAGNGDIVVLDEISMDVPKTKEMVAVMNRLVAGESTLLLLAERDKNVELSARNLPDLKALRATYLNIRDLLGYNKIVMPLAALDVINSFLSSEDFFDDFEDAEEEE
ncbi:MAG: 50S ribosomal protein L4 [Chloroflexi bacterium]|nr:50S ribosomal protein L4 [Chloroflexota bacterium]MBK6710368.1 50S ribosomal protein L4 [Chloroflexota bacterium]MBK7180077.1 50S ribosomal protein L4 [Chloroflexota bacterium]MBK7917708.1 50S ribosomal protein L4 [Chloroflexota bacterium]MBK8934770.1 50S ribosomal protein L4 [Chloroflexota bacterium]